jgi:hypothetical protein
LRDAGGEQDLGRGAGGGWRWSGEGGAVWVGQVALGAVGNRFRGSARVEDGRRLGLDGVNGVRRQSLAHEQGLCMPLL